ncbi:MAG: quinone oxidoreductase family protein [Gemmatimonadaceae bacterium]
MLSVVIYGASGAHELRPAVRPTVTVDGVRVGCGLMDMPRPAFDPDAPPTAGKVLVQVTAVSCNYRDKAFFFAMQRVPEHRFTTIGSEFAGCVRAVGSGVTRFRVGDRVTCDHHYDGNVFAADGVRQGVVSNQSSRAYHVLSERKLHHIPPSMSDDAAAAFSLGAQTAYSMVRRASIDVGHSVLITAGASNTSLFLLAAAIRRGASVTMITTSARAVDRLSALGAERVVLTERAPGGREVSAAIERSARERDGFDAILDPFFDLHAEAAVTALRPGGAYVTCGFAGQNANSMAASGVSDSPLLYPVLSLAMRKNLSIIGNCIGLASDLDRALEDAGAHRVAPVIDSVFSGPSDVAPFFNRTYNDPFRLGKVVFHYGA